MVEDMDDDRRSEPPYVLDERSMLDAWLEFHRAASRVAAAQFSLDHTGIRDGKPCSLRWIYLHMIEEYARHNGHADLIRELIDRNVGW